MSVKEWMTRARIAWHEAWSEAAAAKIDHMRAKAERARYSQRRHDIRAREIRDEWMTEQ